MATIAELLKNHVTLEVESFDRLYLNGYVPRLQTPGDLVNFLVQHRGYPIPSPALLSQVTQNFIHQIDSFLQREQIPRVPFQPGQKKKVLAHGLRQAHPRHDAVVFVGVAQEKASAFKGRKIAPEGRPHFDYSRQAVFVNHYYFYLDDEDFGPAFIKICSYFPFPIRICLNGHEWVKRQLQKRSIPYKSLDNGFSGCEAPKTLQEIADQLGPSQIEAFFSKWVERLPFPLTAEDRAAGYCHELSVWQMEFSLTHIFARPQRGREFFEEVIRENLDLGRPDRVQLLFQRKITKATPGRFRTRVITSGVHPSLHIEYKHTEIVQYFKGNTGLRTETRIKEAKDFGLGRRLHNLPHLRKIASHINHRLLEVEKVSQNCILSEASVQRLTQPTVTPDGQRAPGLKFGDPRVTALLAALCLFLHLPNGFCSSDLRRHVADLMGEQAAPYGPAQATYDLRRLRLKGILCRLRHRHRYFLTPYGWQVCLFMTRLYARVFRPALATIQDPQGLQIPHPLRQALDGVDRQITKMLENVHLKRA